MNYVFKYKNLVHAFKKEIKNNGPLSLYQGAVPFFATYVSFICLQFTIYETIMKHFKVKLGREEFEKQENKVNFAAGLAAGAIGAAITNPLECITVNK